MKRNLLSFLKVFISIGLAILLLYLVFRNVEWRDFWMKAKSVDYSWVILSIGLSLISYFARAYRWNILLEPFGYNLKTSRTTLAVLIGYLGNLALPRLGEIARCGVMNRNDDVPIPTALGTVVVDRLLDIAALLVLMGLSLIVEYDRLKQFLSTAYKDLQVPTWLWYVFSALIIGGILVMVYFVKYRHNLKGKYLEIIKGFMDGIASLKDIKNLTGLIVSTILVWGIYFLMSYVIIFSLPETADLGLGAGLMLLITGGIALSLPVQSGFGTYHGMIAGMLLLYSIEQNTGIFIATLLHTSQIVAISFFGTIALIISFFIRRKKRLSNQ